jgi:hypothetical protein
LPAAVLAEQLEDLRFTTHDEHRYVTARDGRIDVRSLALRVDAVR